MNKNNCNKVFLFIIFSILIISTTAIVKLLQVNEQLKNAVPYLLPNETIEGFNLLDSNGQNFNNGILDSEIPILIYITEGNCSRCDKNFIYIKKALSILKGKLNPLIVVLANPTEAISFAEKSKLEAVYTPSDITEFKDKLRIKIKSPHTILYKNGVKYIKIGNLDSQDVLKIVKTVNNL